MVGWLVGWLVGSPSQYRLWCFEELFTKTTIVYCARQELQGTVTVQMCWTAHCESSHSGLCSCCKASDTAVRLDWSGANDRAPATMGRTRERTSSFAGCKRSPLCICDVI